MKHLLISIFAITLIACGGAEERKAAYLEKARISIEAGDFDKARIELKNVLQIDPKDAEAVFQLGNVHEQKKDYQKAFSNFAKAAELVPENTEYQAKLGTYYLLGGDNEKVREIINNTNAKTPGNVDIGVLNVSLLVRENDIEGGIALAKKVMNDNPGELKPVLILAQIYKKQTDYDSALVMLDKASKIKNDDTSIKKEMASIHLHLKNYDNAETIVKEMIRLEPDNYKNHTLLAVLYKEKGDPGIGEDVLRQALSLESAGITGKMTLASYINETRGMAAAESELISLIKSSEKGDTNTLRMVLAKLYHDSKRNNEETEVYKKIIASGDYSSIGMNARINLCKAYIGANDIEKAEATINDALTVSPNDADALLLRSKLSLLRNDVDRAVIDLRLVIKDKPEEIEAYTLLVGAYIKNKELDQVKEILNSAYDRNVYNASALLELAELNIKLKNIEGAEKAADGAIRVEGNNLKALVIKVKILNTKKDYQQAKEIASQIIDLYPGNADGYLLISPAMLNIGQTDELYQLINGGYSKTKNDIRLLEILVAINSGQKKFDNAISLLKSEIDKRGEKAELYRMLAKVYDASGKTGDAISNFRKAINVNKNWAELYAELANIYLRSNDADSAQLVLRQGKLQLPDDNGLRMSLAVLYEKTNQPDNAIREYEELLSSDADNVVVINNLAAMLSDHRKDKESINRALEMADKLKESKQPALLDTVGWVYYRAGKYDEAVKILELAVAQSPDVAVFNYHLGMALSQVGDKESAKTYLTKSLSGNNSFPGKDEAEAQLKKL